MTCKNWNSLKAYMVLSLCDPTSSLLHNQLLNFFWTLELGGKKKKHISCNSSVQPSIVLSAALQQSRTKLWIAALGSCAICENSLLSTGSSVLPTFAFGGCLYDVVSIARQSKLASAKQLTGVKCNLASSIVPLQWPRHAGACATLAPIQLVPKTFEAIRCRTSTIATLV